MSLVHYYQKNPTFVENQSPDYGTYRKFWNACGPFKYPLGLDVELTNACNLHCSFCRTSHNKFSNKFLSLDLYEKIIRTGGPLFTIKFNWRGEPLLHPDILEFIKIARKYQVTDIYFNTNGTLLDERMIEELLTSGLHRISISIDGYDKITYQGYRKGAIWDKILKNVSCLYGTNKIMKHPINIRIQTVQLPGIDTTEYINFWSPFCDDILILKMKNEVNYELNEGLVEDFCCPQLSQRMVITCEGNILPCNEDHKENMILGNIQDTTINEAWNSELRRTIYGIHQDCNSHILTACNRCPLRAIEIMEKRQNG